MERDRQRVERDYLSQLAVLGLQKRKFDVVPTGILVATRVL